jgi:hypothetical protein
LVHPPCITELDAFHVCQSIYTRTTGVESQYLCGCSRWVSYNPRLYLSHGHMKSDLAGLSYGNAPLHRQMTIGDIALELLSGDKAPRINALSMASSGIHMDSELHVYVCTRTPLAMDLLIAPSFQSYFRRQSSNGRMLSGWGQPYLHHWFGRGAECLAHYVGSRYLSHEPFRCKRL